ncbi:hypothetical protein GGS20DRAFT_470994 [Poronia punctata]|nr:hypothetical protein GGS20DRAFT_470994 [Poronia punctata]
MLISIPSPRGRQPFRSFVLFFLSVFTLFLLRMLADASVGSTNCEQNEVTSSGLGWQLAIFGDWGLFPRLYGDISADWLQGINMFPGKS